MDITVYYDNNTGTSYIYNGKKFVPLTTHSKSLQIGDIGDVNILDQEEKERQEQIEREKAEDIANGTYNPDEYEDVEAREARLTRIADNLANPDLENQARSEAEEKVTREKTDKARRQQIKKEKEQARKNAEIYRKSPALKKFVVSLNDFIANEIGVDDVRTYNKFNKKAYAAGYIDKGHKNKPSAKVPSINVYYDRSGSWGPDKSEVGRQAISTLNEYVEQGKLKIYVYYFNHEIMSSDPGRGYGGTRGTPIMKHIAETQPDNVIIMTDDDIRDIDSKTIVKGGVWLLFKGGVSTNLQSSIKGKKLTKSFLI